MKHRSYEVMLQLWGLEQCFWFERMEVLDLLGFTIVGTLFFFVQILTHKLKENNRVGKELAKVV